MPFDIRDPLLDEEGYVDEEAVEQYQRELIRLFKASAEAHELRQQGIPCGERSRLEPWFLIGGFGKRMSALDRASFLAAP